MRPRISSLYSQNGTFRSTRFEFISQKEPFRNRVEYKNKIITIKINEVQGEFLDGKILWELKGGDGDEVVYLEWVLLSIKNSSYDEKNNSFTKVYNAKFALLGRVQGEPLDIFITKFFKDKTYRIDIFDPVMKTINRLDKLTKL